jgi:hypothetical protein
MPVTVKAECGECRGTGLYSGFAEPKGVAVICLRCAGTGCMDLKYTPFTKRVRRQGIKYVMWSRGAFLATGIGPEGDKSRKHGGQITYEEFEQGRMP